MLGFVLAVLYWRSDARRDLYAALGTMFIGFAWYLICTQLVIPYFNDGRQPFYLEYFYGSYGGTFPEIAQTMARHPDQLVRDVTQPDRLRFYRDLLLPLGGLPLAAPLELLMALPQLLASAIGSSPYARSIRYQYTAVMIAPITIAAIEGGRWLWGRFRVVRVGLIPWLLVWAYVDERGVVAVADRHRLRPGVGAREPAAGVARGRGRECAGRRFGHRDVRAAPAPVPPRADLQLAEPVRHVVLGQRRRLPPAGPSNDRVRRRRPTAGRATEQQLLADLIDGDPYEILFDQEDVVVARRVSPDT